MALTVTFQSQKGTVSTAADNSTDFTTMAAGTASADRWVIVAVHGFGSNRSITTCNCNGVGMTPVVQVGSGSLQPCGLFMALVPTGTTVNIEPIFSGVVSSGCAVAVFTITGTSNLTVPVGGTGSQVSANPCTAAIATVAGGVMIAAGGRNGSTAGTWGADVSQKYQAVTTPAQLRTGGTNTTTGATLNPNLTFSSAVTTNMVAASFQDSAATPVTTTIAQTLPGFTQAATAVESEPSAIAQTLPGFTQAATAVESEPSAIAQTLPGFAQEIDVTGSMPTTIAQTLPSFAQEIDATESMPTTIAQTLPGFTQVLNGLMVPNADITTTLFAPTQSLTGSEQPNAVVTTTLFPLTQALSVSAAIPSVIAQTLPGFTQEIDDTVIANKTSINMILGAKNASASAVDVGERTHTGNFIGHPTVSASAFAAGSMVVAVLSSVSSTGVGRSVTSIVTVPGQPAWQKRSSFAGSQQASGVGLEVWWFIATGPISPTACQVVWDGNLSSWENVCIEYANVDSAQPWDLDPSLPAIATNSSLSGTAIPNITGLSTRADHTTLVGFFGANTGISPTPLSGYTKDVFESSGGGSHTNSTIVEVSKSVDLPQSGIAIGLASGGTAWNFIADAIRPKQLTTAITQDLETSISPVGSADIVLTLQTISQEVDVTVHPTAIIDQTFPGFNQEEIDIASTACIIDQTLRGFTTESDDHVTLPGSDVAGQTDQTFEGLTQRITVASYAGFIDQTFEGFTQRADVDEELPSDIVEQNLFAIQMEADVVEILPFAIDQTLPGISQEIDVVESVECTVDQTLAGFGQEIDVSALRIDIDQTLLGFTQELDATETDPEGVIGMRIDQTLVGFQQEIDVSVLKCDITVELHGLTQRAAIHVREETHPRQNFGAIMPSKEMPIHPGELELFRGGRVNAMVPPTAVAYQNLTTARYPGGRSPVAAIPPLVKPR